MRQLPLRKGQTFPVNLVGQNLILLALGLNSVSSQFPRLGNKTLSFFCTSVYLRNFFLLAIPVEEALMKSFVCMN